MHQPEIKENIKFCICILFVFVSKLDFERFWKKDKLLKEQFPNFFLCFVGKYFQDGSYFLTKSRTPLFKDMPFLANMDTFWPILNNTISIF